LDRLNKQDLENAADLLKRQHADIKSDTFLKFLATLDIFTRYLDLQYTSKHATRSGFNVLNTLVLCGGTMTPTEISKKLYRSKNAICHVVATLESHGLVTTVRADKDRRSIEVRITDMGLALTVSESIVARELLGQRVFGIFTEDELGFLNNILERLIQRTRKRLDEPEQGKK
jgi:DNA-binding MarR family transcriptional regulator